MTSSYVIDLRPALGLAVLAHAVLLNVINAPWNKMTQSHSDRALALTLELTTQLKQRADSQKFNRKPTRDQTPIADSIISESLKSAELTTQANPNNRAVQPSVAQQLIVQGFVDEMIADELKNPQRLTAFRQTFATSSQGEASTKLVEHDDGGVDVQTQLFGRSVCYSFNADGDPPMFFPKRCPETELIKLRLD